MSNNRRQQQPTKPSVPEVSVPGPSQEIQAPVSVQEIQAPVSVQVEAVTVESQPEDTVKRLTPGEVTVKDISVTGIVQILRTMDADQLLEIFQEISGMLIQDSPEDDQATDDTVTAEGWATLIIARMMKDQVPESDHLNYIRAEWSRFLDTHEAGTRNGQQVNLRIAISKLSQILNSLGRAI